MAKTDRDTIRISFTRQSEDDQLDDVLRALHRRGARVLDVDVERSTLFDVLERYEKDDVVTEP